MRRVETRIERLEQETVARVPERITTAWLLKQPAPRIEEIFGMMPDAELERIGNELKAEIEDIDAPASTPT
jgi:predicted oxidoreductase